MKTMNKIKFFLLLIIFVVMYIIINSFDIGIKYNNIKLVNFAESIGLGKDKNSDLTFDIIEKYKFARLTLEDRNLLEHLINLGYATDVKYEDDKRKDEYYNILRSSVYRDDYKTVQLILKYKHKFKIDKNKLFNQTLLSACRSSEPLNSYKIIYILLKHGADHYEKDKRGYDCIKYSLDNNSYFDYKAELIC